MILVKLKVNTKPKERIAMVEEKKAMQLIKAHPNIYSLVEKKTTPKDDKKEESKDKK